MALNQLHEPQEVTDLRNSEKAAGASVSEIARKLAAKIREIQDTDPAEIDPQGDSWGAWEELLQAINTRPCIATCYAVHPLGSPELAACIARCGEGGINALIALVGPCAAECYLWPEGSSERTDCLLRCNELSNATSPG